MIIPEMAVGDIAATVVADDKWDAQHYNTGHLWKVGEGQLLCSNKWIMPVRQD